MEKAYEPSKYEAEIYSLWEKSGAFKPDLKGKKDPFSIIMPPPNSNGSLHLGHAMYVLEDIMVRFRRMAGHPTLWLPGADHAGIETQVVFERELAKQGKSRFDLGPTKFYDEVLKFTQGNQATMISQLKSLGFSADWSKLKFTLDADIVETVYDTFKKLYKDGLIYRGPRIVNWCVRCQAAFADIEVKYRDQDDQLYTLDYGPVQIATTRPETIFADVAVAVNPKDNRYKALIGKNALIPLLDRPVPVIADIAVDLKFGTGALKITPGHDQTDYEIGQRHNLPEISVINQQGQMENVPEALLGLSPADARTKTIELLKKAGKLIKTTPLRHAVGYHDRCGTIIEPLVTEQWWIKTTPLAGPAIKAIKDGQIKIVPKRFEKVYVDWLENLRDWNISRQIWWGIRIPVYYNAGATGKDPYLITADENEAIKYYGKGNYRAETDTFDTWFSSGQWPFATLMASGDFDRFYPTAVMETGRDILFLWVTRMVMLGLYRTGEVPFRTIYLHGLVNDAKGAKMSKSKGNVIDPLQITAKHGTDALRLALTIGITPGQDGSLSEEKIIGYRNFCNKLWNVARFVQDKASSNTHAQNSKIETSTLPDKWMLNRLAETTAQVTKHIENYRFSDAGQAVYSLLWDDFADWYLEANKSEANTALLVHCLETILKLAHPFAPFVTEAIWQDLAWQKQNLLTSPWPDIQINYSKESQQFTRLQSIITEIRNAKAELGLGKAEIYHSSDLLSQNSDLVQRLAGVTIGTKEGSGLALSSTNEKIWLNLTPDQIKHRVASLQNRLGECERYLDGLQKQLDNKHFLKSAPKTVIKQVKDSQIKAKELRDKLRAEFKTSQI